MKLQGYKVTGLQGYKGPAGARAGFPRAKAGVTLIELIGVLAVFAIIAVAVVSSVIRRIDQAARDRETSDLNTLAQGLVQAVKAEKRIPAVGGISASIANYRGMAPSQVTTNARRFSRAILLKGNIGANDLQSTAYVQSNTVPATRPTSVRVLFVSTLAPPALPSLATNFDAIWNAPEGSLPAPLGGRDVHDLKIQRLDLAPLFHRVHLQNIDGTLAQYTFNTNTPSVVTNGTLRTVYVIDGTALNLYGSSGNLQLREILTDDQSFVYQKGTWSRDLSSPKLTPTLNPFGQLVADFLAAEWNNANNGAENGARPQAAIETMFNYMLEYIIWSRGDPAHGIPAWQGAGEANAIPQYPYFNRMQDAQTQLDNVSDNLIR